MSLGKGIKSKFVMAAVGLAALVGVAGCANDPISTVSTENPQISYSVLFNRNGCEVGRFKDAGEYVYITICPGAGTSSTSYDVTEGKATRPVMNVQTRQQAQDGLQEIAPVVP